ncbi:uncharacterized protein LOC124362348 [Homalodisca vitripennis]|uniref:uncharacterized protein LOC124362348 n=1 Tax=Homalodisca vitripennis TaxID=197043 RepID=UPI001EE9D214|nr:uncharacterized protein LOC124362348 [Homalodisca vitripennis]
MLRSLLLSAFFGLVTVNSFKITSRVDSSDVPPSGRSYPKSLDPPFPDHLAYDAVFAGVKKPLTVDCTQSGVICKFPLVISDKDQEASNPAKIAKEVPIIKGIEVPERLDDSEEKEEITVSSFIDKGDVKVPIYRGSLDVESISDSRDNEETWILEKNTLNKKYKIPVRLIPSKHNQAPVYPVHHDFHDHFSGGDLYHGHGHGSGWTPWMRAYPSVYHYPSNQPCQPPVYHHPPPCTPAVAPTRKPVINIDDKVDKDED